ncbi:MAG: SAM-dependent methyltransferase, partial [Sediminibacterium sp.]
MYAFLRRNWLYVQYWLNASNGKGHGIHSPFVFKFVTEVLNDTRSFYAFELIANSRKALLANNTLLKKDRQIIRASDQIKYGELLFRIVHFFSSQNILEIGNSFGITTAYMSTANEKA